MPLINWPNTVAIALQVGDFEEQFCTYEHWLKHGDELKLMYVGCCKLREVYLFPDARRNTEWQKYFLKDTTAIVRIIATSDKLFDCQNVMSRVFKESRPHCNVKGYRSTGRTVITCNETGEVFDSILQAARAKGLSQSQLTNHINNRAGYKSVKGFTFHRGIATPPQPAPKANIFAADIGDSEL